MTGSFKSYAISRYRMNNFFKKLSVLIFVFALIFGAVNSAGAQILASVSRTLVYDTSVEIEGKVTDPNITSVMIAYGTSSTQFGVNDVERGNVNANGEFFIKIRELRPSTLYYYQLRNGFTGEALGSVRNFTTKSLLLSFGIGAVTQTTVTYSGTASSTATDVYVRLENENSTFTKEFQIKPDVDKRFFERISGLNPDTTYFLTIVRKTDQAEALLTGIRTFTTLLVWVRPSIGEITSTTAVVRASVSSGVKSASILWGTASEDLSKEVKMTTLDTGTGIRNYNGKISGLKALTNYYYKVKVTSGLDDKTAYSDLFTFTTSDTAEKPATTGIIKDITMGSLDLKGAGGTLPAYDGNLVPCGGLDCKFEHVIKLISNIIDIAIFVAAPIIATLIALYAGFLLLTSGGATEQMSKAKEMLMHVVLGLVVAMGAWLIIKFILIAVGYDTSIFPKFWVD